MPSPSVYKLDPSKVTMTVNDAVVTGFADGEYIRATPLEDRFDRLSGVQGSSVLAGRIGVPAEIRIRLLPTSPILPMIRDLCARGAIFPIVVKDANEGAESGFTAEQAWVKRMPDFPRAKDAAGNVVEVVFETNHIVFKGANQ